MKRVIYILSIPILLCSCKKDIVPSQNDPSINMECDCEPIPELEGPNNGYTYLEDTIYNFYPQYNPNNSNEILYCNFNNSGGLVMNKFNIVSGQKTILYSGSMSYAPSWGKNDWILFDKADGQIWKMKSNGDSLTLATHGGAFFHPEWNESGEYFFTYQGGVDNSLYFNGKIWNLSGQIVDSIDIVYSNGDWRLQENFGFVTGNSIQVFDLINNSVIRTLTPAPPVNYNGFNWIRENEAIVTSTDGIYHYDILLDKLTLIKCTCDSRLFVQASINENGSKLIFTKITITPINTHTLLVKRELVEMSTIDYSFNTINLP